MQSRYVISRLQQNAVIMRSSVTFPPWAPLCCGSCWVDGESGSLSSAGAGTEDRKHTPPASKEMTLIRLINSKYSLNSTCFYWTSKRHFEWKLTVISAVHWGQRCPLDVSTEWDLLMMDSRVCSSTSRRLSTIISTSSWTEDSWNTEM